MKTVVLIALLAVSSPAVAQLRVLPQRSYWTEAQLSHAATRKIVADFARCAVRKRPAKAAGFVLDPRLDSTDLSLFDSFCLGRDHPGVQLRLHNDGMAYALADELVRREGPGLVGRVVGAGPINHGEAAELPVPPEVARDSIKLAQWQASGQRSRGYAILSRFGECVVRTAPNQSAAMIAASVASKAEQAAMEALAPALSDCIEKGGKLSFNKFTLRGTVALNLYRLAHAPRVVPSVVK